MAEIALPRGAELFIGPWELGLRWKHRKDIPQAFRHVLWAGIHDIRGDEYYHPRYGVTVERCIGWQFIIHVHYHQLRLSYV